MLTKASLLMCVFCPVREALQASEPDEEREDTVECCRRCVKPLKDCTCPKEETNVEA